MNHHSFGPISISGHAELLVADLLLPTSLLTCLTHGCREAVGEGWESPTEPKSERRAEVVHLAIEGSPEVGSIYSIDLFYLDK
jgi:hypothetical protein